MIWVLVVGSRDWQDSQSLWMELDRLHNIYHQNMIVVTGGCKNGADSDALAWAEFREIPYLTWPARWNNGMKGNGEGPQRNGIMANFLHESYTERGPHTVRCLAFDMKKADGTKNAINYIENYDMNLQVFTERGLVYERKAGFSDNETRYSQLVEQSRISY